MCEGMRDSADLDDPLITGTIYSDTTGGNWE